VQKKTIRKKLYEKSISNYGSENIETSDVEKLKQKPFCGVEWVDFEISKNTFFYFQSATL